MKNSNHQKKLLLAFITLLFISIIICYFVVPVNSADTTTTLTQTGSKAAASPNIKLQVPIFDYTQAKDIAEYIAKIYGYALYILVPIAIIVIIYAGARWILAAGNMPQIKEAKNYIVNAFIGLTIALFGYLILSLLGLTQLSTPSVTYIDPIATGDQFELQPNEQFAQTPPGTPPPSNFKGQAIYVHWSAGNPSSIANDYTFAVTGDGVIHQNYSEYNGAKCTRGRNAKGNMCVGLMGANGFTYSCYKDSDVYGRPKCPASGQFTEKQVAAARAKIQELKNKFNIPSYTHSDAALMDKYHCVVTNVPGWSAGKYGCKWDFYGKDALFR